MNKTYRTVFNAAAGTWAVASELAKGRKKSNMSAAALVVAAAAVFTTPNAEAADYAAGGGTTSSGLYGCNIVPTPFFPSGCTGNISQYGTAVGDGSSAASGTAVGDHATSTGGLATAIGNYSYAVYSGTAVGLGAYAEGRYSSALGRGARAGGASSVALGISATSTADNSVALGGDSLADRNNTVSVGNATTKRQITNMAAGTATTDAVNVSQLAPVVTALGGGATIDPTTGAVTGPTYTLANGGTQTTIGGALGALDGALTTANDNIAKNATDITNLNTQLGDLSSGTIGIVQQNPTTGAITVGAASGGSMVNFAGTGGARVLSGVANGVADDDVVTVSQLRATGLIDYSGKEVGAVTYDSGLSFDSVTFAGTNGTVLHRVAAGDISATSMDAVNGSQLYALQQEFAQKYGDLSGRVGDLEAGGGSDGGSGSGVGTGTGGPGSIVVGNGADASGSNSSAIGQGSVASGNNGTATGQGAVASGDNSSAFGQGAVASGGSSTAIGQNANASGNNSVALGAGSVADRDNAVSVGSAGAERQITNVAAGTAPTDAVNVQQMNNTVSSARQDAMGGVAAAMAVAGLPQSTQPGRTFVSMAGSTYGGEYGSAMGLSYMTRDGKWTVKAAVNTSSRGEVGGVIGGGFYW